MGSRKRAAPGGGGVVIDLSEVLEEAPPKRQHTAAAGYMFCANRATRKEVLSRRLFGSTRSRVGLMSASIGQSTALYLWDYEAREVVGRMLAAGACGLDREASAFDGRFGAQVRFSLSGPLRTGSVGRAEKSYREGPLSAEAVREIEARLDAARPSPDVAIALDRLDEADDCVSIRLENRDADREVACDIDAHDRLLSSGLRLPPAADTVLRLRNLDAVDSLRVTLYDPRTPDAPFLVRDLAGFARQPTADRPTRIVPRGAATSLPPKCPRRIGAALREARPPRS